MDCSPLLNRLLGLLRIIHTIISFIKHLFQVNLPTVIEVRKLSHGSNLNMERDEVQKVSVLSQKKGSK